MWSATFVLADRVKTTLLTWLAIMVVAATVSDVLGYADNLILPLSILSLLAQAFIVAAALRVEAPQNPNIRPRFGLVFLIGLVSWIAIGLGFVLLVIPGMFLLVRWWVAVPVAVDRDIGTMEALRESWQLTAPHWMPILGLALGFTAVILLAAGGVFMLGGFDSDVMTVPQSLIMNLFTYGATNLGTVGTVAAYRQITSTQEDLRAVFE